MITTILAALIPAIISVIAGLLERQAADRKARKAVEKSVHDRYQEREDAHQQKINAALGRSDDDVDLTRPRWRRELATL